MPQAPVRRPRLTRAETKARTRALLLEGALKILDEEGESALTTTAVTKYAGISQPSFYAHFSDMDDLLHSLIEELGEERRRNIKQARADAWATGDVERLRDIFRIPLAYSAEHPRLFRLLLKSRLDRSSPLGEWSRSMHAQQREALVEDLLAVGRPKPDAADRRTAEMIADGIIALTETMILGHIEGRYPDVEEIVDVLLAFNSSYSLLLGGPAAELARARALQMLDAPPTS